MGGLAIDFDHALFLPIRFYNFLWKNLMTWSKLLFKYWIFDTKWREHPFLCISYLYRPDIWARMGALGSREAVSGQETGHTCQSVTRAWTAASSTSKVPWGWGWGEILWESGKWGASTGEHDHMNGHGLSQSTHTGGRSGEQKSSLIQASDVDSSLISRSFFQSFL